MVRAEYDSEARAMSIWLVDDTGWRPAPVQDVGEWVFVWRDTTGRTVGIEILHADQTPDADVLAAAEVCGVPGHQVLAARDAALRAPDESVRLTFSAAFAA